MANQFASPMWVTKDTAKNFKSSTKLIGQFDRSYDDQYRQAGAKMGYTVNARIQSRFTVTEGQALVPQPILNQVVPISVNHQFHTDMEWSSADDTMLVEEVETRYTRPAGQALANKWDAVAGQEVYKSIYFAAGTPGQLVSDNDTWLNLVALLSSAGAPTEDLVAVVSPRQAAKLTAINLTSFNKQLNTDFFRSGQFSGGQLGVAEWYTDPNLPVHTTGSFTASTPAVAGASQTGSTLLIDGMGTYAFKAGDVFSIAGVNMVNPLSYVDSGELQTFSIQADIAGSSTATLQISPAIITSGPLQTVTNSPANDAAISFIGSTGTVGATMTATKSKQGLVFDPAAFAFVMVDLKSPLPGATSRRISSKASGISMRYAEQYQASTDQLPTRIDTLGGIAPVLPYFAARIYT